MVLISSTVQKFLLEGLGNFNLATGHILSNSVTIMNGDVLEVLKSKCITNMTFGGIYVYCCRLARVACESKAKDNEYFQENSSSHELQKIWYQSSPGFGPRKGEPSLWAFCISHRSLVLEPLANLSCSDIALCGEVSYRSFLSDFYRFFKRSMTLVQRIVR